METDKLISLAMLWLDAFNQKDINKLLALYADEAKHYSPKLKARHPETEGLISGKSSLRAWWLDAFERLPSLHYVLQRLTPYQDRVFMEYIRQVPEEEDLWVGEMLEVKDGLIIQSTVFHR